MSFILDALRKSEHERQRGAVPKVAQIPFALPRNRVPLWAPVAIGVLVLALTVTTAAWWRSTAVPARLAETAVANDARAPSSASASSGAGAEPTRAALTEPESSAVAYTALRQPESTTAPRPTLPDPESSVIGRSELAAAAARSESSLASESLASAEPPGANVGRASTASASRIASAAGLPRADTLSAQGIAPLTLELQFYDADASRRFVYVNGRKYREGESLREGPQLLSIEPHGVVLGYAGREFSLLPE